MKFLIVSLSSLFLFSSCITKSITEKEIFNPIKEYRINDSFIFTENLIKKNDSIEIETWYLTMPNAKFNLIYLSGNGSNIRSAIPFFNSLGTKTSVNIFSLNYSGYGLSTGTPSIQGVIEDTELAITYFSNIKKNNLPTILLGYSLGGFVALTVSQNPLIDKVVIMSSFSSAEELELYLKKEALPKIARPILKIDVDEKVYALNNLEKITKLEKPTLIVHGEKDDFIPPKMGKKLYDLCISKQKYFVEIKGADHRTILKDEDKSTLVAAEIIRFVNSN